jgi:hypothetical protein
VPPDLIESKWICVGSVRTEPRRNLSEIVWESLVTWFVHEGLYARQALFLTADADKPGGDAARRLSLRLIG